MKHIAVAASLLLSLSAGHGKLAAEPKFSSSHDKVSADAGDQRNFSIHVAAGDWGNAQPEEIETLLNDITAEMLTHFPGRRLAPIEVLPTRRAPVVLYQKGPANQYQVYLAAKGRSWGEYIYEFSHELFHILSNYENHAPPGEAHHQWFEEMMCEAVSLYNLKRMSLSWEVSAPRTEWALYAPALNRFTQRALNEPHRRLPADISLAQWFREHGQSLLGNPYLRAKNEMVAMLFLPLLEQNADWSAVGFLNPPGARNTMNFYEHLADWYKNTPDAKRSFVVHTMNLFEFHIPATTAHASTTRQPRTDMAASLASASDAAASEVGAAGPPANKFVISNP
jgi:hypothetical protein